MRVVKESTIHDIRITVFSWNNKYLVKYEQGFIEQTYKINELDMENEEGLSPFFEEEFLKKIQEKMDEMHQLRNNQLENC